MVRMSEQGRTAVIRRGIRPPVVRDTGDAVSSPPSSPYPRNLKGYGRDQPDPRWPGNARVAVQFVMNFEEGGENSVLHGDAASEAFLSDVLGAKPLPGQRNMNVEFDVRIRLARRILATVANVHRTEDSAHGVRRGRCACPQSVMRGGHARSRLGDRKPRLEMDRLQGFFLRRRERPYARGDTRPHRGDRRTAVGVVHGTHFPAYAQARSRRRRLSLLRRIPTPTICPIG